MHFTILGGAGFIGSHLASFFLKKGHKVLVLDLFKGNLNGVLKELAKDPNFVFQELDVRDTAKLAEILPNKSIVIHLASNPDIAAAANNPRIDFTNGTLLTESALEAARLVGVKHFIYASGSGVYKEDYDNSLIETSELLPISTYGASKLAGEALASAYSFMFGMKVSIFRFANVVGGFQTHGIGYDFMRKLKSNPLSLNVMGDGNQTKSYVDVIDIAHGIQCVLDRQTSRFEIYNLSNIDSISVKKIAELAVRTSGHSNDSVEIKFGSSPRGWLGDVPIIRLDSTKLRSLGWSNEMTSEEAIVTSLRLIWNEIN